MRLTSSIPSCATLIGQDIRELYPINGCCSIYLLCCGERTSFVILFCRDEAEVVWWDCLHGVSLFSYRGTIVVPHRFCLLFQETWSRIGLHGRQGCTSLHYIIYLLAQAKSDLGHAAVGLRSFLLLAQYIKLWRGSLMQRRHCSLLD